MIAPRSTVFLGMYREKLQALSGMQKVKNQQKKIVFSTVAGILIGWFALFTGGIYFKVIEGGELLPLVSVAISTTFLLLLMMGKQKKCTGR